MTGKNVYTMTAMTRRAFVGLAVMAAQAGLAGCVRNGTPDAGSSDGGAGKSGDAGTSSPFAPQQSAQASVDGISIYRVTIEEVTGPDGKPFRYIRVAYTFENVTDSDAVAPYTDINAYQDGIKLDRSYKVQDQRAQKQIEPGGKLKSFTAFAPDSETVPVTVKVITPGSGASPIHSRTNAHLCAYASEHLGTYMATKAGGSAPRRNRKDRSQ